MRGLYHFFLIVYFLGIHLLSLFSNKARLWVKGRRSLMHSMQEAAGADRPDRKVRHTLWFHCASLGEFEQGRPVIESVKAAYPECRLLLTFFSPSGFEVRKNYPVADHVFYLPLDTPGNVRRFLDLWKPDLAVFVKYEYWFNYLDALHKAGTPVFVISAIFRPGQYFFRTWGRWFLKHLKTVSCFFIQDEASAELLRKQNIRQVVLSGDTRFDRVWQLSKNPESLPEVAAFKGDEKVLVAGSTWPADETLLRQLINDESLKLKYIIAPHEVHEDRIRQLEQLAPGNTVRHSQWIKNPDARARLMIIDGIGFLSHVYQYGHVAYIGGGFGDGIHNILEAATYGLPVFFGPKYQKFAEARELLKRGGVYSVSNAETMRDLLRPIIEKEDELRRHAAICREFVESGRGAASIITTHITEKLNLSESS
ncbi:MAG: glycosyltransferase N-terminal domain-containing protein [Bacteroidales bacterium]|nr:glycosyltransferase N-terminal domain-containing protein [Bacteroidales bacterium]